jgi:hypothetical protein
MRSAADLDLPMIGVTLASRAGYFRQEITAGRQVERPDLWQPEKWAQRVSAKVAELTMPPIATRSSCSQTYMLTGGFCNLPMNRDITKNIAPIRIATLPTSHTTILGSIKISTPSTISSAPGSMRNEAECGFSIIRSHISAIGHIAIGFASGACSANFDFARRCKIVSAIVHLLGTARRSIR